MIVTTLASLILLFIKFWGQLTNPALRQNALILLPVDIIMFVLSLGVVALALRAIARFRAQAAPKAPEPVGV